MEGWDRSTYGSSFADVYDRWYHDLTDAQACAEMLAGIADGGTVLELGVGTGRLALPLAAAGAPVVGLDVSSEMLEILVSKPSGRSVRPVRADMTALPLRGPFAVVFVSFSTFFNLVTQQDQRYCVEEVARVLAPDGSFVVETFVPRDDIAERTDWVSVRDVETDRLVLHAGRVDLDAQTVSAQHVEVTEDGIRLSPLFVRYLYPEQLDEMAAAAGLRITAEYSGWSGEPFDESSANRIAVYRR